MKPQSVPYQHFGGPFATSEIIKSIRNGEIIISPWPGDIEHPEEWVEGASIDLSLGPELRIPLDKDQLAELTEDKAKIPTGMTAIPCMGDAIPDYMFLTRPAIIPEGNVYILRPREKVIAITKEKITFKNNICALIGARSCAARLWLVAEFAPVIKPGVNNRVVLEIKNDGDNPITLRPGSRFCQLTFFRAIGEEEHYEGKYKNQSLILHGETPKFVGVAYKPIKELPGFVFVSDKVLERLNRRFPII